MSKVDILGTPGSLDLHCSYGPRGGVIYKRGAPLITANTPTTRHEALLCSRCFTCTDYFYLLACFFGL